MKVILHRLFIQYIIYMIDQLITKIQSFFPYKRKKAIEDWDFIMVFEEYYRGEVQIMFNALQCDKDISWTSVQNPNQKQVLFLVKMSDNVVIDMAHELKILKKKDKNSFKLKLKQINKLIYVTDKQSNPSVYNYLCFLRGRMSKKNKQIYEQQKYSAFNKYKIQKFVKDGKGRLFTYQQQLRAKYHYMVTYTEKVKNQQNTLAGQDNAKEPFNVIMKHPGFIELVPIQKVSEHRSLILGSVKDYVGPNIACYFDFVSFLQKWLIFPMIVGLLTVIFNSHFNYTADNSPFDFIYALAIMLWSILFITRWQQIQKWTKVKQDCGTSQIWTQFQQMISRKGLQKRMSPVTGQVQYYLSFKLRFLLALASNALSILMLFTTLVFIVYSLNARGFIDPDHKLFYSETVSSWAGPGGIFDSKTLKGQIPIIIHVVVTNGFDQNVYRRTVKKLAKFQRHQTRKGYQNSIILKYFVYEFFITFADLFYIAFVRLDIQGLREQLLSLFFIDIVRRVVAQTIIPAIRKKHRSYSLKSSYKSATNEKQRLSYIKNQMGKQQQLQYGAILEVNKDDYEPFDDYLQIITNIGYLVMISSCFPLAPLLIFIAHGVEIIQDRYKIIHITKRKLPQSYVGMGRWKNIIVFISYLSIVTNIMLFAFSSQQVVSFFPKMYEGGKDLLYGNTDIATLINDATTNILQSVLNPLNVTIGLSILNSTVIDGTQIFHTNNQNEIETISQQQKQINKEQTQFTQNLNKLENHQQNSLHHVESRPMILKQFKPPKKQSQMTFMAILFFIEHFFLLLFILVRDMLKKRKSEAEIFLERRQYKRRIKKNLAPNILNVLVGDLLVTQVVGTYMGKAPQNILQSSSIAQSPAPQTQEQKINQTRSTNATQLSFSQMSTSKVVSQKQD